MVELVDNDFRYAIHRLARAINGKSQAELRKALADGTTAAVINLLRSGASLSPGECIELGYLLSGEYGVRQGPKTDARTRALRECDRRVTKRLKGEGKGKTLRAAIKHVVVEWNNHPIEHDGRGASITERQLADYRNRPRNRK